MRRLPSLLAVSALLPLSVAGRVSEEIPLKARAFVPKGYEAMSDGVVQADLNSDGRMDLALALNSPGLEEANGEAKRWLVVLLNTGDGYQPAGRSSEVMMCKDCGGVFGDPWAGLTATKGILSVSHYGGSAWRWSNEQKFRYQQGGMYLIGSTSDYFWTMSDCNGEGVGDAGRKYKDTNWITGDEEIIENTDDCKPIKHIKHKIKKRPLVRLEAYKNH